MDEIYRSLAQFIAQHPKQVLVGLLLWAVFSSAMSALPTPVQSSRPLYRWFFYFGHGLSCNPGRIGPMRQLLCWIFKIPYAEASANDQKPK